MIGKLFIAVHRLLTSLFIAATLATFVESLLCYDDVNIGTVNNQGNVCSSECCSYTQHTGGSLDGISLMGVISQGCAAPNQLRFCTREFSGQTLDGDRPDGDGFEGVSVRMRFCNSGDFCNSNYVGSMKPEMRKLKCYDGVHSPATPRLSDTASSCDGTCCQLTEYSNGTLNGRSLIGYTVQGCASARHARYCNDRYIMSFLEGSTADSGGFQGVKTKTKFCKSRDFCNDVAAMIDQSKLRSETVRLAGSGRGAAPQPAITDFVSSATTSPRPLITSKAESLHRDNTQANFQTTENLTSKVRCFEGMRTQNESTFCLGWCCTYTLYVAGTFQGDNLAGTVTQGCAPPRHSYLCEEGYLGRWIRGGRAAGGGYEGVEVETKFCKGSFCNSLFNS